MWGIKGKGHDSGRQGLSKKGKAWKSMPSAGGDVDDNDVRTETFITHS